MKEQRGKRDERRKEKGRNYMRRREREKCKKIK